MDLREYLAVMRKRWISIVAITIIVVGIAAMYTLASPKSYTSKAQSFVALTSKNTTDGADLAGAQFAAQRVKSYTQVITSPDVLAPVIGKLGLPYTVDQLAGMVTATNPPLTVLLDVSATSNSAEESAAIANATSIQMGRVIEQLETPALPVDPNLTGKKAIAAAEKARAEAVPPVKVSLINPATIPGGPSAPNSKINLALGLLLGLGAGLAWAFLRNALDNTVKSQQTLDEMTGVPVLAAVVNDPAAKNHAIVLDSASMRSEGYRTVRTNMQYVDVDNPPKVLAITSASPGDGKTTTAANLAVTFALLGMRVCLVGADLRKPRLGEYLGIDSSAGLTDVLAGQIKLEDALQGWNRNMMAVLPSGTLPPNPSELLGSAAMAHTLGRLREMFDVVVIDTCPLLSVSDAAIVAAQADGAILVVRYGQSTREHVDHAISALAQVNARLFGTVLNAVPRRRGSKYTYGYGYGYGDKSVPTDQAAPGSIDVVLPEAAPVPSGAPAQAAPTAAPAPPAPAPEAPKPRAPRRRAAPKPETPAPDAQAPEADQPPAAT